MTLLTGSANCVKYVLFAFNFLFVITGIILISVGVTVSAVYDEYEIFLLKKFFSIPTLLIVTGSFVFIIAFFGCCGAIKENYCMILIFSILLGLIFILELAGGIAGYVLRADTEDLVKGKLMDSMNSYADPKHKDVTVLWDYIQRNFHCCGVESFRDWNTTNIDPKNGLPLSCCDLPNGVVEFKCTDANESKELHREGCLSAFSEYISAHAVSLGAAGIILAIVQFAGIFFACYIARELRIQRGGGSGLFTR